jgi:hypothetical protein
MVDTLLRQVALVSESDQIDPGDLTGVSAALQKQVTRDLVQFWNVKATVDAFPQLEDVPIGYWPILIKDNIGFDAAGIHLDEDNQPFALVTASDDRDVWSLTVSHELIEMLVDPFGNRLMAGDSPKPDQKRVQFLVEACDPPEAAEFAYTVNGILVSDFYSARFFDPIAAPEYAIRSRAQSGNPERCFEAGISAGSTLPPIRGGKRLGSTAIAPPSATLDK